jgi:acetyltransferase-like isoleucine patch superfamily enzyme/acyl carrier protein
VAAAGPLGRLWADAGLRRARDRFWLRAASSVGRDVRLEGKPFIDNQGVLSLGDDLFIGSSPVQSHMVVAKGAELSLGAGSHVSFGAAISAYDRVRIGERTRIGPFVVIMDSDFHVAGDRAAPAPPKPIVIGDDVVIESRVTILRGSTIGSGARIRSGSVVSGQIAAGVVAAGVPANAWSEESAATSDVRSVVMSALNLASLPDLADGPAQIAEWDSFGALKLLLSLEKNFKVTIREEQIKGARCIADLAAVVEAARLASPR